EPSHALALPIEDGSGWTRFRLQPRLLAKKTALVPGMAEISHVSPFEKGHTMRISQRLLPQCRHPVQAARLWHRARSATTPRAPPPTTLRGISPMCAREGA